MVTLSTYSLVRVLLRANVRHYWNDWHCKYMESYEKDIMYILMVHLPVRLEGERVGHFHLRSKPRRISNSKRIQLSRNDE